VTRKPRRARRSGQAIVEFALASFIFIFTVVGLLEGGRVIFSWVSLSNGVQEGGRLAALAPDTRWTEANVKTRVQDRAHLIDIKTSDITVKVNNGARTFSAREAGDRVKVTAKFDYVPVVAMVFDGQTKITFEYSSEYTVE
jgi:Flp pilus assembly protein TadG